MKTPDGFHSPSLNSIALKWSAKNRVIERFLFLFFFLTFMYHVGQKQFSTFVKKLNV